MPDTINFVNAGIYETIDTEIGQRNVVMTINSASDQETSALEMQTCRAYDVTKETVSMEHNAAYGTQPSQTNDIEMQSCGAYEVEKSVRMEHNAAYGTRPSQVN